MAASLPENEIRTAVAAIYRQLSSAGLNSGTAGNVSHRFEDGLLISPTGATSEAITPEAIVSVSLDGAVRGPGIPSSEWSMHAEIYRRHANAGAVIHTHADACVALSCLRQSIPPFHYMVASFGGNEVPCADYALFGSHDLALSAAEALDTHTACLLANHGMICYGATLDKAMATAVKLETIARQYWMSLQIGTPILLTNAEMVAVHERYRRGYGTPVR